MPFFLLMKEFLFLFLLFFLRVVDSNAQNLDETLHRYYSISNGAEFANVFCGDTISILYDGENPRMMFSFLNLFPDTIWICNKRPKHPQLYNHFAIETNYNAAYHQSRQKEYTDSRNIEGKPFRLNGYFEEKVPYRGDLHYLFLTDMNGNDIKWRFGDKENNNSYILSSSILRRLHSLIGKSFYAPDSTHQEYKCVGVSYSIKIINGKWKPLLTLELQTPNKQIISSINGKPQVTAIRPKSHEITSSKGNEIIK